MSTDLLPMPAPGLPSPASRGTSQLLENAKHLEDLWHYGKFLLASRMIPSSITTPEAAVVVMLKGAELGIGEMHAFDSISVIQGKPTISPQLMLALIERSGLLEDMQVQEDKDSCTITLKRRGRTGQSVRFDRAEAVAMELAGKPNWKKQFSVMMYWRCVAKACRRVFPDVIAGCYTPDEMGADVGEDGEIVINGEVMEPPAKLPPPVPSKPGLFSKEHAQRTQKFTQWLGDQCRATNKDWLQGDGDEHGWEGWESLLARAREDDLDVPAKVDEFMPYQRARGHLWKWAIEKKYLTFDPGVDIEEAKTRQIDAYIAQVAIDHFQELKAELANYIRLKREEACDAIYRKHPDLAPAGWVDPKAEEDEGHEVVIVHSAALTMPEDDPDDAPWDAGRE